MADILTPEWWNVRAREREGFTAVMNGGVPLLETLAETDRQKRAIISLPLNWTRHQEQNGRMVEVTQSDLTVLDLGCGKARLTPWLNFVSRGAIGVDWSPEMLAQARRSYGNDVEFVEADFAKPNSKQFKAGQFDVCFQWSAFCHLPTEERWHAAVANAKRWASKYIVYGDKVTGVVGAPHVRVWTIDEIKAAMAPWDCVFEEPYLIRAGDIPVDEFHILLFRSPEARAEEEARGAEDVAATKEPETDEAMPAGEF